MPKPESEFPTIADLIDRLEDLREAGLGGLPVQVLVVPDSTIQAIARNAGRSPGDKPALMIDFPEPNGLRSPVTVASTERMSGSAPVIRVQ